MRQPRGTIRSPAPAEESSPASPTRDPRTAPPGLQNSPLGCREGEWGVRGCHTHKHSQLPGSPALPSSFRDPGAETRGGPPCLSPSSWGQPPNFGGVPSSGGAGGRPPLSLPVVAPYFGILPGQCPGIPGTLQGRWQLKCPVSRAVQPRWPLPGTPSSFAQSTRLTSGLQDHPEPCCASLW